MDLPEQIFELEEKIRKTPYHKGTEHQVGRWRARIAKLKHQMWGRQTKKVGGGQGYAVKKSGDATVVLVGPPSVGKSSLINRFSLAKSKVGSYDFTTLTVIPGMMKYKGAMIQIFDLPGLVSGAAQGKSRSREVLSVIRTADLVLVVVDLARVKMVDQIKKELGEFGIRLDEELPSLLVVNKIDLLKKDQKPQISGYSPILISAQKNQGIEELKEAIWQKLNLMRVYLKPKGKTVDLNKPLIVKKGVNLKEILTKINLSNKERVSRVKIYGPGAKFESQEASFSFQPQEGTTIMFC